jgi:hypothetical protein
VFDHGAQYFTARTAWLRERVAAWQRAGVVAPWTPRGRAVTGDPARDAEPWWVGTPHMGALAGHLAEGLDVRQEITVRAVEHRDRAWTVGAIAVGDRPLAFAADALVVALPFAQAAALVGGASPLLASVVVRHTPCWAVMVAARGGPNRAVDVIEDRSGGVIAWAAREDGKPGRASIDGEERWTLHASAEWSDAHLEDTPDAVRDALVGAFFDDGAVQITYARAHRWRYARGQAGLDEGALWDAGTSLAACGDWVGRARVEGAITSGLRAAERVAGV